MKRFAAQYVYCSPSLIIPKGVIELDSEGFVKEFFTLNDFPEELHSTEFYNGIIIPNLLSQEEISNCIGTRIFTQLELKIKLGKEPLSIGKKANLYILEHLDLINLYVTPQTKVRSLL